MREDPLRVRTKFRASTGQRLAKATPTSLAGSFTRCSLDIGIAGVEIRTDALNGSCSCAVWRSQAMLPAILVIRVSEIRNWLGTDGSCEPEDHNAKTVQRLLAHSTLALSLVSVIAAQTPGGSGNERSYQER